MDNKIIDLCNSTIENYKFVKEELRYDGEYINHFASLIYANLGKTIPINKIKKIRSYIKEQTSRMSCFRGDILYILSFLISMEDNIENFIEDIIKTYDLLLDTGFKESQYLVLTSYSLVKHSSTENRFSKVMDMKEVYDTIKRKYYNLTNDEDYLECALLVLSDIEKDEISSNIDSVFESISKLDIFSKNGVQGLTMSLVLSQNDNQLCKIDELLLKFEEDDMKISHQFLPVLGASVSLCDSEVYMNEVNEIIKYLREEEYIYDFYMDKSFLIFIAITINEFSKVNNKERYLNELISLSVYSFLVSKNQGVFSEVLA